MNEILKPFRKLIEELEQEIEINEARKKFGTLSYEGNFTLSCDKHTLGRIQVAYRSSKALYDGIKDIKVEK